jgi:hypothetical protein
MPTPLVIGTCRVCGAPIEAPLTAGHPPEYCGEECRQKWRKDYKAAQQRERRARDRRAAVELKAAEAAAEDARRAAMAPAEREELEAAEEAERIRLAQEKQAESDRKADERRRRKAAPAADAVAGASWIPAAEDGQTTADFTKVHPGKLFYWQRDQDGGFKAQLHAATHRQEAERLIAIGERGGLRPAWVLEVPDHLHYLIEEVAAELPELSPRSRPQRRRVQVA